MNKNIWNLFFALLFFSCTQQKPSSKEIITVDKNWLDSIINKSDTSWKKPYRNNEYVSAEYYIDKKDSIVTQLMKDSAKTIRQINIAKYDNVRIFFAEYYSNGQLKARLPLDTKGRYNGPGKFFYENGYVRSKGNFNHGFYYGEWKNFDEMGNQISTDKYDENGQMINTHK